MTVKTPLLKSIKRLKSNESSVQPDSKPSEDDFFLTHEFCTPLASVLSLSEILHDNEDMDAEKRREFLGIIIDETERLTRLVKQMLDIPGFPELNRKIRTRVSGIGNL